MIMLYKVLLGIFAAISLVPSFYFGVKFLLYGNSELIKAMGVLFLAITFFILKAFLDFVTKEIYDDE